MALIVTLGANARATQKSQFGSKTTVRGTIAFDASYPTNGELLLLSQIGLSSVDQMKLFPYKGYVFEWDNTNKKIKVYYGDNNNASDGPLVEVPNTTDISTLDLVPFEAVGDESA